MKSSGIGGQAVIEGVMMKNRGQYAIAIRKPNGEIEVDVKSCTDASKRGTFFKLPIIRGIFAFIDSLTIGMKTLRYSASFYEEEDDKQLDNLARTGKERAMDVLTVALSVILALIIFVLVPMLISSFISPYLKFDHSGLVVSVIEGVLRVLIFVLYIVLISQMDDIKRMFMYHGAEHKCINCIEHGRSLTVDNVRRSSKEHKRCGTSFMLNVMLISILLFMIIDVNNIALKLVLRLVLIPIIAGISYEFTRLAGNTDNKFVNLLSKPGLLMQALTTKEPDDSMIEVGIASVEAVFDWEPFVEELKNERRAVRNGNILKIKADEEAEAKEKAAERENNRNNSSDRRKDAGRSKNDNRNNDNRNNNRNKQNKNKQGQGKNRNNNSNNNNSNNNSNNNNNNNDRSDNKTERREKHREEKGIEAVAAEELRKTHTEEKKTVPPISEEAFKPLEVDISDLFDIKLPETEEKNVRNFHKSIRGVEQVDDATLAMRRQQNEKEADELLAALDIMFEYEGTKTVTEMSEDPAVATDENVVFDFDSDAVKNAQEAIDMEIVKQGTV